MSRSLVYAGKMGGLRLIGLAVGLLTAGMISLLGLVMTVRVVFPEWYAVPGAVLQMTGQRVPAAPIPEDPLRVADEAPPPLPAPIEPVTAPEVVPTPLPTMTAA